MRLFQRQAGLNQNLVQQRAGGGGVSYSWIAELAQLYLYVRLRRQAFIILFLEMCLWVLLKLQNKEMCKHLYIYI